MSTVQERIRAGAAFLDTKQPGWRKKLDLERLDMGHCNDCILGELYGGFWTGLIKIGLVTSTDHYNGPGSEFGFDLGPRAHRGDLDLAYKRLTRAWKKFLAEETTDGP